MSITRLPLRPLPSMSTTCMRYFSTGSNKQGPQDGILDILASSTAPARSPTNTTRPRSGPSLTGMASSMGLTAKTPTRELAESERTAQYQRQIYRKWQPGDVYAPHDLSGTEQKKWKYGRKKPQQDAFDVLGVNPILEYKNFTMMSEYMTEMGRVKHSKDTGLRPKNQRKVAKAIRRAIGLGLMPSVHRHPLVLKKSSPSRFL
ncbi:ribosomal protein S18 [Alternaria rosae]|uniref:ribosomal protein S18 n=1 Tax=Alternaria rosae TaxID=1187941 RepID=UPI001E8DD3F8|nr:ribosomal protein S18 [Alternaria rosae]KAH6865297.1 ribosomal protein S18 [Alternaria rosae]